MPEPTQTLRTVALPDPQFPMIMLVFADNIDDTGVVQWLISKPHPFVTDVNVVRMFVDGRGGVEVYSVSSDGKKCMRDFIPMDRVRLLQEVMPLDVFIEELAEAEAGDPEDDDPEPVPEDIAPVNGQASS